MCKPVTCDKDLVHGRILTFEFHEVPSGGGAVESLVCFQSCRDGVGCGTEAEFCDAAIACRLDANSYQVSAICQGNQRA